MIQVEVMSRVFDHLSLGVVFFDGRGQVSWLNRSASEILRKGDGLRLLGQKLVANEFTEESNLLEGVVRKALGICWNGRPHGVSSLRISRSGGRSSLHLFVMPLRAEFGPVLDVCAPAVAVLISDMEHSAEVPAAQLQSLYGLSSAEARVALKLLGGSSMEAVSDALAISMSTLRTHLKRIFDKTRVRSQAELMRLLLSGPAQLRLR